MFGSEIFLTGEQPWELPAVVTSCVNYLEGGKLLPLPLIDHL